MGGGSMDALQQTPQGPETWTIVLEITGPISAADAKTLSIAFHKCLDDAKTKYNIKYHIGLNAKGGPLKIWSK